MEWTEWKEWTRRKDGMDGMDGGTKWKWKEWNGMDPGRKWNEGKQTPSARDEAQAFLDLPRLEAGGSAGVTAQATRVVAGQPIRSESEFLPLARREAVDRVMVVRERAFHDR